MPKRLTRALGRLPIRVKLTLAFSAGIAVVLAAIGLFLDQQFVTDLDSSVNQSLRARANQITALIQDPHRVPVEQLPLGHGTESFAQILSPTGQVLNASRGLNAPLLRPGELARAQHAPVVVGRHEHTQMLAVPVIGRRVIVVVGQSLGRHERVIDTLGEELLISGPLALLLASVLAYALAAAALAPVESMRRRAATISAGQISARLPLPESVDEIHRLGSTLNEMLARLEQSFEHERAFVADASHELRMPLTVLKAELEVALMEHTTPGATRDALTSAAEEADRVIALAEDLLVLAGADRNRLQLELRPVRLAELLDVAADRYSEPMTRSGRRLIVEAHDDAITRLDAVRVQQAIANLLDNALRYGRGTITLIARTDGTQVEIHVTDEGPGFPPAFLPRAFERFSRAESARGRGGAGLGLAIVESIARAHGGKAHAANRPSGGAEVWVALPATGSLASQGREPVGQEASAS